MKHWYSPFFPSLGIGICLAIVPMQAAPPELFTSDYYAANAAQWLGKEVTLSVAYFSPADAKFSVDNMEVMDAYTFHNHVNGGHMDVAAPPEVFARLKTLCGLHLEKKAGWVQTKQIHGIFRQRDGQYYLQVEK